MPRSVLEESRIHPAVRDIVAGSHADIVSEVQAAIAAHPVVVVGMAQNPWPKFARRALDKAGVAHHYLEYGSYFGGWRGRTALKGTFVGFAVLLLAYVGSRFVLEVVLGRA